MTELFILTDDLTGALDTGVQFAAAGAVALVITDRSMDLRNVDQKVQVLVVDAETRHMNPAQASQTIRDIMERASQIGVRYIYKKTDSALRGNIGAELEAALKASGRPRIHFLPAFPSMGRITRNGIHYVDGVPVSQSVFGQDPFEPVEDSSVAKIIAKQTALPIHEMGSVLPEGKLPEGILVYDSTTEEELKSLAEQLDQRGELVLTAGCAGFAAVLPHLLGLEGTKTKAGFTDPCLLVACGSVNPITVAQLDTAEQAGVGRFHLTPQQKLEPSWVDSPEADAFAALWSHRCGQDGVYILDSNDPKGSQQTVQYAERHRMSLEAVRVNISACLGAMVKKMLDHGLQATLLLTGGDTLLAFMQCMGIQMLEPMGEVAPGAVLSGFTYHGRDYRVVSKSGGFGKNSLILDLNLLLKQKN